MAPRFLAVVALCEPRGRARRWWGIALFASGSCVAYALAGATGGFAQARFGASPLVYGAFAVAAIAAGVAVIVRTPHAACDRATGRYGAGFLAGFAGALAGAPCCAPFAFALAGTASARGPQYAAIVLASFALGQTLPLFVAAAGWSKANALLERALTSAGSATVAGAILVALGAYYAVLA
jgi:cytochrome c biogenesis protein CcdA